MPKIPSLAIAEKILRGIVTQGIPDTSLTAVRVGDNPASISFLRQKKQAAEKIGIRYEERVLSESATEIEVASLLASLAKDPKVGGIILQLPLPSQLNQKQLLQLIPSSKDVDVLSGESKQKNYVPAPPLGVVNAILEAEKISLTDKKVALIGWGELIGHPIATYLAGQNIVHRIFRRSDHSLQEELNLFDVVISGTGVGSLFGPEHLKPGALVVDFGWQKDESTGKISGDYNSKNNEEEERKGIRATTTPGGTGPILVAKILENFSILADKTAPIDKSNSAML